MSKSSHHHILHHHHRRALAPAHAKGQATVFQIQHVQPALTQIGLWDLNAERLLMGTAAIESRFIYVRQFGGGPAFGYWQMEQKTHDDLRDRFLRQSQYADLAEKIKKMLVGKEEPIIETCMTNHRYAVAMARVKYLSCSGDIPATLDGQARYWKNKYNCSLHGSSIDDYKKVWGQLCASVYPNFA